VEYDEKNLSEIFGHFGEIESIKIIEAREDGAPGVPKSGPRAFVCFKTPDAAAIARASLHGRKIDNRNLFVTNYELPEIRKKQQTETKDRNDFIIHRKQFAPQIDANFLQRPDTIQLI
jgi:RNA recognition motif-containing protein